MNDDARAPDRRAPPKPQRQNEDRRPPAQEQRRPEQEQRRPEQERPEAPAQEVKADPRQATIPGLKTFAPEQADSRVVMLVYGSYGTGKTYAATQAPRPLFLSTQRQSQGTIAEANAVHEQKAHVVDCSSWEELEAAVAAIERAVASGRFPFETIVVDLVSELHTLATSYVCGLPPGVVPRKQLDIGTQGRINAHVEGLVIRVRQLPVHLIMIAHAVDEVKEDSKRRSIKPAIGDRLMKKVAGSCNLIGFAYVNQKGTYENERLVRSLAFETPSPKVDMIARRGGLVGPVEPHDIARIFRLYQGTQDAPKADDKAPMLTDDPPVETPTQESEAR